MKRTTFLFIATAIPLALAAAAELMLPVRERTAKQAHVARAREPFDRDSGKCAASHKKNRWSGYSRADLA